MDARTDGTAGPSGTPAESEEREPTLLELRDDEILAWLSASPVDEADPTDLAAERDAQAPSDDFWDRVAQAEASLTALGYTGPDAVLQAISLVGLEVSLSGGGDVAQPGTLMSAPTGPSLGEQDLVQLQTELVAAAQRAVSVWASLQGSALRAAAQAKG